MRSIVTVVMTTGCAASVAAVGWHVLLALLMFGALAALEPCLKSLASLQVLSRLNRCLLSPPPPPPSSSSSSSSSVCSGKVLLALHQVVPAGHATVALPQLGIRILMTCTTRALAAGCWLLATATTTATSVLLRRTGRALGARWRYRKSRWDSPLCRRSCRRHHRYSNARTAAVCINPIIAPATAKLGGGKCQNTVFRCAASSAETVPLLTIFWMSPSPPPPPSRCRCCRAGTPCWTVGSFAVPLRRWLAADDCGGAHRPRGSCRGRRGGGRARRVRRSCGGGSRGRGRGRGANVPTGRQGSMSRSYDVGGGTDDRKHLM